MKKLTHKYRAKKTQNDGFNFDSKLEARFYLHLKNQQEKGNIVFFLRQVPFHLPGNVKYVCDFQVFWEDGDISFIDIKGMDTPMSKAKRKLVEGHYPLEIEVIKNVTHPKSI